MTHYVLFVIELATRRVAICGITTNPNEAWMLQMARNLMDSESGALLGKRHLIVDRDTKYSSAFRAFLAREGVDVIRLPPRSPNLNAYSERFVRSIKSECLSKLIPIGATMLRRALREYMDHYHLERNHQGLDNQLIIPTPVRCPKVAADRLPISPRRHTTVLRTCRGINALEFSNNTSRLQASLILRRRCSAAKTSFDASEISIGELPTNSTAVRGCP